MKKILMLVLILSVLLSGCINQQDKLDYCMVGCVAGAYYNEGSFHEIPTVDESNVKVILDCENLCNVAIQNSNLVERGKKFTQKYT